MRFEGQPMKSDTQIEAALENSEIYEISEQVVQDALMELWADKMNMDQEQRNEIALAWINNGLASLYREYVEKHPGVSIDLADKDKLNEIVGEELVPNQLH